jgi:peroxiredoxin Q/BCP
MIGPGAPAPTLVAENQFGAVESLSDYLGEWVVLWWYPKAMTPGCTSCGKAFVQAKYDFDRVGCRIIGVSFDSPDDNLAFSKEYDFDFLLLSATREDAERWMTARSPESEWAAYPQRISYLADLEQLR